MFFFPKEHVEQSPGCMYFSFMFPGIKNPFLLKYSTPSGFLDSSIIIT